MGKGKKEKKAYQRVLEHEDIPMPWGVMRLFMGGNKELRICGDELCFGEDYVTLKEAREAFEWIVDQLGGTVEWKNEEE